MKTILIILFAITIFSCVEEEEKSYRWQANKILWAIDYAEGSEEEKKYHKLVMIRDLMKLDGEFTKEDFDKFYEKFCELFGEDLKEYKPTSKDDKKVNDFLSN